MDLDQIEGAEFEFLGLEIRFERNREIEFVEFDFEFRILEIDFRIQILIS